MLPVGGVLLAESIIEPLSGRMVKVGGASMRAGQLRPNAGGYQALLDSKVLSDAQKIMHDALNLWTIIHLITLFRNCLIHILYLEYDKTDFLFFESQICYERGTCCVFVAKKLLLN